MRAREMLNRIKWHPDCHEEDYEVIYLHRGAPNDERKIGFNDIIRLCTSDFIVLDDDGFEVYIPYHRIIRIIENKDNIIWQKRGISG